MERMSLPSAPESKKPEPTLLLLDISLYGNKPLMA